MSWSRLDKGQKKILMICALCAVVLVVLYAAGTQISRIGMVKTTVKFAPYTAEVRLNGKKVKNGSDKNYLAPGEYRVEVTLNGFDTVKQTLTLEGSEKYIIGQLLPNNDSGRTLSERYAHQYTEVERIVGEESAMAGDAWRKNHPILDELPINTLLYSIGYTYDIDGNIVITVKTKSSIRRSAAVARILEITKDKPEKYRVVFDGYENPFGVGE